MRRGSSDACASMLGQGRNLEFYWIDTDGGAATLIVAPTGETLLFDTGFTVNDRAPKRIMAAIHDAGVKKIDSVVIGHWHDDHVGGLAALSKMTPVCGRREWSSCISRQRSKRASFSSCVSDEAKNTTCI